jgi:histidinol-phosphate aminotransferase
VLKKTLPPYAVPSPVVDIAEQALSPEAIVKMQARVDELKQNRQILIEGLLTCERVEKVFETEANFILIRFKDANCLFDELKTRSIFIRNQTAQITLDGCLRISVGTRSECEKVIETIRALG